MRLIRAGGALVWRFRDPLRPMIPGEPIGEDDIEVLLVHRPQYRDWSWPKGKVESRENILAAAVREVEEETGHVVRLHAPLTTQRYRLGSGQTKEVRYWVGTVVGNPQSAEYRSIVPLRQPAHRAPAREIDEVRWVDPAHADRMLTRRGDRRLLTELMMRAHNGELVTAAVAFLPYAKAVPAHQWSADDALRPLTRQGVRQALDLVDICAAFGFQRAYSAQNVRARQTVGPWAALSGVEVRVSELVSQTGDMSVEDSAAFVDEIVGTGSDPVLVCAERAVVPRLLDAWRLHAPSAVRMNFPVDERELVASELCVLHTARESVSRELRVVGMERHAPRTREAHDA